MNDKNLKFEMGHPSGDSSSVIWISCFAFVSDFGFRVSDFLKETKPFSRNT